jgi:hypothetical protein
MAKSARWFCLHPFSARRAVTRPAAVLAPEPRPGGLPFRIVSRAFRANLPVRAGGAAALDCVGWLEHLVLARGDVYLQQPILAAGATSAGR